MASASSTCATARALRERTATLETSPLPVIDAGFDAYIRSTGTAWAGTAATRFPFLIPSRLGTLRFKVKRMDDTQIGGRAARQYQLGLASWIGFALPHINVAYDSATRELLRFNGMANIRGSSGDNVKAKIVFDPAKRQARVFQRSCNRHDRAVGWSLQDSLNAGLPAR